LNKNYSKQLNFFKLEAGGRLLLLLSKNRSPLLKNNEDQYEGLGDGLFETNFSVVLEMRRYEKLVIVIKLTT